MSNFRAWASSTFSNLRLGEEKPKSREGIPGSNAQDLPGPLGVNGGLPGLEQELEGGPVAPAPEAYHTSWDEWQEVCTHQGGLCRGDLIRWHRERGRERERESE